MPTKIETMGLRLKNGNKNFLKRFKGRSLYAIAASLLQHTIALLIYQWYYLEPITLYDRVMAVEIAAACITLHYVKRIYETLFVNRLSRDTTTPRNVLMNCAYHWSFTAYMARDINHEWYVAPAMAQVWTTLVIFLLCEYGNYAVHLKLWDLESTGTKEPQIPMPDNNVFTKLFHLVSCPDYTYEICGWIAFAVMTTCLAALLFAIVGAFLMSKYALKKHQSYLNTFEHYPKQRRAIFPYML